ncbi:hypothetical protein GGD61_004970 [Bradyrhizobium sp. SBR1B]|nr:hypothetical protein [Bradyrhizobium sp. SBR1B]
MNGWSQTRKARGGPTGGATERRQIKLLIKHLQDAPNTLDNQATWIGPDFLGIRTLRLPLFGDTRMKLRALSIVRE